MTEKEELKTPVKPLTPEQVSNAPNDIRHTLLLGARPNLGKSILGQYIAFKLGFTLVSTENKEPYYPFPPNRYYTAKTLDGLEKLVSKLVKNKVHVVVDSISAPYEYSTKGVPWEKRSEYTAKMTSVMSTVHNIGGIVISHGKSSKAVDYTGLKYQNGDRGKEFDNKSIEFNFTGGGSWTFYQSIKALIGRVGDSPGRTCIIQGNKVPQLVLDFDIVNGTMNYNGKTYEVAIPKGKAVDYLIERMKTKLVMKVSSTESKNTTKDESK